MSVVMVMRPF